MKIKHYTTSEYIIDRDDDIKQIKKLLCEAVKSQVHIIFAKTGYGKTSFSKKLSRENSFVSWDVVKVESKPKNANENVTEGEYLELVFHALRKHFETKGHTHLLFENYLTSGKNTLLKSLALNEAVDTLASADPFRTILTKLIGSTSKRLLKVGVFNPHAIIYDDSTTSRSIKAEYIHYLFEHTRVLLIIENIQNIDNVSCKYLLDWINDTKEQKHGFLFEFTISETHDIQAVKSLQQSIVRTGADVYESELEKISMEYIADIIEAQLENRPSDIHFTIRTQYHYDKYSNGNLWDLLDFARVYDDNEQSVELPTPTLSILHSLSSESKYIVSLLFYHNGRMDQPLLSYIWLNCFSNKPESYLEETYQELICACTISIQASENVGRISISHASILDVWQAERIAFSAIDREVYKRLSAFYHNNYYGNIRIVDKQFAWQMLMRLYAIHQPDKIMELLDDLKANLTKTISRENTWNYLKLLIQNTQNRIVELETVYFEILQICCNASLYDEGYSCLELMESQIDIEKNDRLFLNKLLYLSILDKHHEVIKLYKKALGKVVKHGKTWVNLKLLVLNSYIAVGDQKSCWIIHRELTLMPNLKQMPEYAIFLRLINIYAKPSHAVKSAKKSIALFRKQGNREQEGKSFITYSKLLSSLGNHKKAIKAIKCAETLLAGKNEGMSCIYNNWAGYLLLSGEHGPDVWNYLDIAEIHSISTYDKLSVVLNKLAWCYENNAVARLDLLENKALELIELEPSQFIHCTTFYNLYVAMQMAGEEYKANKYYQSSIALKEKCSCVKARVDGLTHKTRYLKPRIKTPYHICYLSFWVYDLQW